MSRTITALYDSRAEAETARAKLTAAGVDSSSIDITSQESSSGASSGSDGGESRGFFGALKNMFMPDEDRHAYHEGVSRGGHLLSARVDENRAEEVIHVLDDTGAVDFDARQSEWRQSGWTAPQTAYAGETSDNGERVGTIPVAEEHLRVGKREVERGGVRVRSYVESQPASEQVDLREEHVEVERRPVDQKLTTGDADALFREQTLEMTERGEEAVVAKEAVVREEIELRKDVQHRTETINDTVRHTEVDVDNAGTVPGERASFRSDESYSDSDVGETDEQRRARHERSGGRPII